MSEGLWRDDLRCGCQKGGGHSCKPIWLTDDEWGDVGSHNITYRVRGATGIDSNAVGLEMKAAPAGNRGLAPALIQAGEEVPMESTQTSPSRHPNTQAD